MSDSKDLDLQEKLMTQLEEMQTEIDGLKNKNLELQSLLQQEKQKKSKSITDAIDHSGTEERYRFQCRIADLEKTKQRMTNTVTGLSVVNVILLTIVIWRGGHG